MADQIYNNLPKDLVTIIAHQQIRNELLKTLSYDIAKLKNTARVSVIAKNNLTAKCHALLEEWMASKSPRTLARVPYNEIAMRAVKMVSDLMAGDKTSMATIFAKLNEVAFGFQQEMEKKYAQ